MTAAFATFANQGLRMKPMYVTRITDRDGNIIEETRPQAHGRHPRRHRLHHDAACCAGVVERGTAARARALKRPIAGKTGTTNDFTDAWFIGFEPSLAAGVWVGFDEKKDSPGHAGRTAARTALPIWMEFWAEAMKDKPIEELPDPGQHRVRARGRGRPARTPPGTPGVRMEAFVAGTEPRARTRSAAAPAPPTP